MPSQKQDFSFPGLSAEQILLLAYGTFSDLGWTPKYAGPTALIGYTPRSWNKHEDDILIEATDGAFTITSSLVHNESFDMLGRNRKHVRDFTSTFEKVKASGVKPEWVEELEKLREQTIEAATGQQKKAEEMNEGVHFKSSHLYVTYSIIAINIVVFILMAINGGGVFEADGYTQVRWGSNFTPLTLSGDWWRLITCMFIHFGIIHLAMNTYALYMAGVYLEPMLGKTKFILAYLCTGVIASIASLWWHSQGVNSAGASGAIFGMYGVFLALLFTNLIPKQIRGALLQSIGVFVVFNLIFGMKAGVDNAAHVGGLVSGVIIGFVFYPLLKKNETGIKNRVVLGAIAGITALFAWMYLSSPGNIVSPEKRQAELNFFNETRSDDGEKFLKKYNEFAEADGRIVRLFNDNSQTYAEWIKKNEQKVNEEFSKAEAIVNAMKGYRISEKAKRKADLLEQLLNARREEVSVIKKLSLEDNDADQRKRIEIQKREEDIIDELKKN